MSEEDNHQERERRGDRRESQAEEEEEEKSCCWRMFKNFLGVSVDVEEDSKFEMIYLQRGDNDRLTEVEVKRLQEMYQYGDDEETQNFHSTEEQ